METISSDLREIGDHSVNKCLCKLDLKKRSEILFRKIEHSSHDKVFICLENQVSLAVLYCAVITTSSSYLLLRLIPVTHFILWFLLTVVSLGMFFASLLCWLYECVVYFWHLDLTKEYIVFGQPLFSMGGTYLKQNTSNHFLSHWIKDGFLLVNYLPLIMFGEA